MKFYQMLMTEGFVEKSVKIIDDKLIENFDLYTHNQAKMQHSPAL